MSIVKNLGDMMMNKLACLSLIKNNYPTLTDVEKKIADYILENRNEIISMSVDKLATKAHVSKSAIIRCCKSIGYDGYKSLKVALTIELSKNKQLNYMPYIVPEDTVSDILDKVLATNIKTLNDTAEKIDRINLEKIVNTLSEAKTIYIYGIGTSAIIVNDFQHRIMQVGYTALGFTDILSMKISTMNITKGDVAIGISHTGRTIATIETLKLAKEKGATTICITSCPQSPITQESTYPLVIYSDEIEYPTEAIAARIAHISAVDAITIALSSKNYAQAMERSYIARELINTIRYGELKHEK